MIFFPNNILPIGYSTSAVAYGTFTGTAKICLRFDQSFSNDLVIKMVASSSQKMNTVGEMVDKINLIKKKQKNMNININQTL